MKRSLDGFGMLSQKERETLRAHQDLMVPTLLSDAASGMDLLTCHAEEPLLSKESLLHISEVSGASAGVVKGYEDLYKEDVADAITEIDRALQEAFLTMPPSKWAVLANLFGDAIRLRLSMQDRKADEYTRVDNKELVTRFLMNVDLLD